MSTTPPMILPAAIRPVTTDTRLTRFWQRGVAYILMITITVLMAVPVMWMFSTAVRPESTVRQYPIQWIRPTLRLRTLRKLSRIIQN